MVFQNKANSFLAVLSAKNPSSKSSSSPAPKKQSNSPWVDLFFKLASNGKLTSNKHKKYFKNNLYLYCSIKDYKLNFCSKKQTMVTLKGHNTLATVDTPAVTSEKPLEK